ncbi:MAG: hypothetical protein ACTSVV_09640 [Promethearchaeota archaeon]
MKKIDYNTEYENLKNIKLMFKSIDNIEDLSLQELNNNLVKSSMLSETVRSMLIEALKNKALYEKAYEHAKFIYESALEAELLHLIHDKELKSESLRTAKAHEDKKIKEYYEKMHLTKIALAEVKTYLEAVKITYDELVKETENISRQITCFGYALQLGLLTDKKGGIKFTNE